MWPRSARSGPSPSASSPCYPSSERLAHTSHIAQGTAIASAVMTVTRRAVLGTSGDSAETVCVHDALHWPAELRGPHTTSRTRKTAAGVPLRTVSRVEMGRGSRGGGGGGGRGPLCAKNVHAPCYIYASMH